MHGEFVEVTPPATNTVLSGSNTALTCLLGSVSGNAPVADHADVADNMDKSITSAEFMPAPLESQPPTTSTLTVGKAFCRIITDMPLQRLIVVGAIYVHEPVGGVGAEKVK